MYGHPGSMIEAGLTIYKGARLSNGVNASRTGKSRIIDHWAKVHRGPGRLVDSMPSDFLSKPQEMGKPCEDLRPLLGAHGLVFDDTFNGEAREPGLKKPVVLNGKVLKKHVPGNATHLPLAFHVKSGSLIDTFSRLKNIYIAVNRPFEMDAEDDSVWNRTEVTPFPRQGFRTKELLDAAVGQGKCAVEKAFVIDEKRVKDDDRLLSMTVRLLVDRIVAVESGRSTWTPRAPAQQQATEALREEMRSAAMAGPVYGRDEALRALRRLIQLRLKKCAPDGDIDEVLDGEAAVRRRQQQCMAFQRAATGKKACYCKRPNFKDACHFTIAHLLAQLKFLAPAASAYWTRQGVGEVVSAVQSELKLDIETIQPRANKSIRNGIWGWTLVPEGEEGVDGRPWEKRIETHEGVMVPDDEEDDPM